MSSCTSLDIELTERARELYKNYGSQVDYFINNGSPIEKRLAQKVKELAGVTL
ncbi:MAG: hypothetical protein WBL02_03410 [Methanomethylovorans sp.]|uniref:hypothetical protein n=1 Tax=Methanomethylovorans sp. TaxID=2758717 RepID=UPI000A8E84B1|nr:hypothetical protein [Methanomethylovorans sp.]